jgi:putative oxidoreductase
VGWGFLLRMWSVLKNYTDAALLFLRLSLGSFYIYAHGWPKLEGGIAKWRVVGTAMHHLGVTFAPAFWGFMAASAESVGCLLLIIGFLFRPSCLMLVITLIVASVSDYASAGAHADAFVRFTKASHAIELCLVFFALMFIGPGRFSVDKG